MKLSIQILVILLLSALFSACSVDEAAVDTRKMVIPAINPADQPHELNEALIIYGDIVGEDMPLSLNPENVTVTVSVESALVTADNYLFLPFSFDVQGELKGIYLQVEGADNHWDAPVELFNPNDNSFAIAIGIPAHIQEGDFVVSYKLYDNVGNVSEDNTINVSIVASENRCGSGQGFSRVEGEEGITVRTYDFGDVAGTVDIYYFMYTQKDRMDVRYNGQWVASTSPQLLVDGQAPPFKTCDEASPAEGFVSGGGSFSIPYDPSISREISIYISGCLQGGTLWYFDVSCPSNSGNPTPGFSVCGNGSIQSDFDPSDQDYHIYPAEGEALETVICDPSVDPGCTLSAVYNAMLTHSNFLAPTTDTSPVSDCKVTWVEGYLPGQNPVVSKLNRFNYSVTNYTVENQRDPNYPEISHTHFLHPGKVTRTISLKDDKIVVSTVGEGIGNNPFGLNIRLAKMVWGNVDDDLKAYWDSTR